MSLGFYFTPSEFSPEVYEETIRRLEEAGALRTIEAVFPVASWSKQQGKGPRKIVREDQKN